MMQLKGETLIFLVILILTLSPQHVCHAEGTEVTVPKRMVLFFEPASDAALSKSELLLLYESLLVKLHNESPQVALYEHADPDHTPSSEQERTATAEEYGVDAWIWVRVGGSTESMVIDVASFDRVENRAAFAFTIEKSSLRRLERWFWQEVVAAVNDAYRGTPQRVVEASTISELPVIIRAKPGTRILGLAEEPLVINGNGQIELHLLPCM